MARGAGFTSFEPLDWESHMNACEGAAGAGRREARWEERRRASRPRSPAACRLTPFSPRHPQTTSCAPEAAAAGARVPCAPPRPLALTAPACRRAAAMLRMLVAGPPLAPWVGGRGSRRGAGGAPPRRPACAHAAQRPRRAAQRSRRRAGQLGRARRALPTCMHPDAIPTPRPLRFPHTHPSPTRARARLSLLNTLPAPAPSARRRRPRPIDCCAHARMSGLVAPRGGR
jgi:hypothetical protein